MEACYIYRSFTTLNSAQHHVCNGELTEVGLSGDVKNGRGSHSWTPAASSARYQDGLHVSTLSLMKACYIYCSFTALNWAQHHVCNAELTDVVLSGDVKNGHGSHSWTPAASSALNQDGLHVATLSLIEACYIYRSLTALNWTKHHVSNGEPSDIVLFGGPSVKRVTGGTVPRIVAEPYLD
ncbi:hypothetical protein V5799_002216 [Amblyomma americanum]|uniref:Uncharacterized protein n=1 Tax=Amblyomma americanum TaxID=6943 RepID=A0AAQ4CXZ5_AMBAM